VKKKRCKRQNLTSRQKAIKILLALRFKTFTRGYKASWGHHTKRKIKHVKEIASQVEVYPNLTSIKLINCVMLGLFLLLVDILNGML